MNWSGERGELGGGETASMSGTGGERHVGKPRHLCQVAYVVTPQFW